MQPTEKKPRRVKPFTDYEEVLLYFVQREIVLLALNDIKQHAGNCDIELSNFCRYQSECTNSKFISLQRLVPPGQSFGELITRAELQANAWHSWYVELNKKMKGNV